MKWQPRRDNIHIKRTVHKMIDTCNQIKQTHQVKEKQFSLRIGFQKYKIAIANLKVVVSVMNKNPSYLVISEESTTLIFIPSQTAPCDLRLVRVCGQNKVLAAIPKHQ